MTEVNHLLQISNSWPLGLPGSDNCIKLYDFSARPSSTVLPALTRMKDMEIRASSNGFEEGDIGLVNNFHADQGIPVPGIKPGFTHASGWNEPFSQDYVEGQEDFLIPGLPEDVAKLCLALVPRLDFPAMSCVSRSWKRLLQSKEFYLVRKGAGTLEEWLYALVEAPGTRTMCWQVLSPDCSKWKGLPPMPGPAKGKFGSVVVDGKLLVMGGSYEETTGSKAAAAEVLKYDSALNRWSKVASMHMARYEFACAVLGGRVYVAGGHGEDGKNLSSVEVYDLQKDEWTQVPSMKRARWGCIACGIEGKIYVMGGRSSFTIGNSRCIAVYDPSTGQWDELKNGCVMVLAHAVLDKKLYCIEWKNERKLVVYNPAENSWKNVPVPVTGSLSLGFCLCSLNGKLVLFPKRADPVCKTLIYDPNGARGVEWQTSAIRPLSSCMFCATITA